MIWVSVAVAIVVAIWLWRRRKREPDPVALVMLLESPRLLSKEHVTAALESAGLSAHNLVEERTSYFRMEIDGYEITVASAPFGYTAINTKGLREQRIHHVIETHKGCLLIDVWKAPEGQKLTDAMPMMGRLMAEFVDESSMGLYSTSTYRMNLIDDELVGMLRSGETDTAMEQVTYDAILKVDGSDPRMVAAVAEARTRWPEFVEAWHAASDRSMFIAKFPFGEGDRVEFMWINPTAIDDDQVTGILMNSPMRVPRIREGDSVTASVENLNDWLFVKDDAPVGMFTEQIVRGG